MVKLQGKDAVKDMQVLDHKASNGPLTGVTKRGLLDSDYAKSKRDLMALINQIRSTGAALEVDLPTIVVAGNQSSGKSSLIEAISGINLPRAAGTCTRVPIEVRLRQEVGREWKTVVKIRREVNDAGDDNSEGHKPEVDFGPVIIDPALVESTIRRAQLAILNPSVPASSFVDYALPVDEVEKPLGSVKQLAFSRNVIVLEISGPNVTDLTLVDLPGIIQNVGKGEDRGNIGLVEDLVKSYISKDCLILLVLTMKDDIQNQKAALLASEVDPDGRRTIGVLTKADTLQGREVDQWVKVLRNEAEPLLHGYYVTRQPNADELAEGISFDTARANELGFFDKTAPWNTLKPKWKARLGTRSLTVSLSEQLLSFIREKLPLLIGHINSRYETVVADLEALGKPPSNDPSSEMMGLVTDFAASIESHIQGGPGHEKLLQDVMAAYMRYKRDLWRTAPRFTPFTAKELDEDEADVQLKMDYAGDVEGVREGPMGPSGQDGKIMDLDDVREHVKRSITRELPNNIPFPAKVNLIKQFTSEWSGLGEGLLAGVRPLLEHRLACLIEDTFGRYAEGLLPASVKESVNEQIRMLADNALLQIHKTASLEDRPFTLNDHYLNDLHARILARLKDKRYPVPTSEDKDNHESNMAQALACLALVGHTGLKEEDLSKLRPTDDYETELDVMAETRAYWQVAYKRTIDNVPRIIDAEFIVPASRVIRNALIHDLSIFAEDGQSRCRKYLAESPVAARQRDELLQRRGRLGHAKEAIRRFGTA